MLGPTNPVANPTTTLDPRQLLGSSTGNNIPLTSDNPSTNTSTPLARIIGPVVGGVVLLAALVLIIVLCIRKRKRSPTVAPTADMIQTADPNFQVQIPNTATSPQTAPMEPSPAWTSQDAVYNSSNITAGYPHGSTYPAAYPMPSPQGYYNGNNYHQPMYPAQANMTQPWAQNPVRLEYPGPLMNTPYFSTNNGPDVQHYSAPPAPPPEHNTILPDMRTSTLSFASQQHLLRPTPSVQGSATPSPPFTPTTAPTQSPPHHPQHGDGAASYHIPNLHEMDGADPRPVVSPPQREIAQPSVDGRT
ncbi:hypothetical protein CVT24_011292 [Panaeolus cyanescens]|uniref:Uncharacterized protein n=1 Tax=Panaeolus cyanescens TaxID=181874 RepID=A0A409YUW2_9AGAR|nr:hypothetical protein CVT24_011292 [Panaeolus cyanescens]